MLSILYTDVQMQSHYVNFLLYNMEFCLNIEIMSIMSLRVCFYGKTELSESGHYTIQFQGVIFITIYVSSAPWSCTV